MEPPKRLIIDISWEALLKVVALVVGILAVYVLHEILIMLLAVFIFVAAVNPTIVRWQKHMSRLLAVTILYVGMAILVGVVLVTVLPQLVRQLNDLVREIPTFVVKSRPLLDRLQSGSLASVFDQAAVTFSATLKGFSNSLIDNAVPFFGSLATVVSGIVLSFYLLLEEKNAKEFFHQLLPQHRFEAVYDTVSKISERMGSWVRGQLILMVVIGLSELVIYLLLGLPTPLPLGLWSGICEVIPYIGPALGILPALIVAFTTGGIIKGLLVFIFAGILVQQLEAHVVVPKIVGRAVGLSPVLVIIAVLVGGKLFGLIGAIVAIPTAATIAVVVGEWHNLRKIWE
jgi:predicted PurR-regulated permease PerM